MGIPGGVAGSDGGIRIAPIGVKGNPANPTGQRWHVATIKRLLSDYRPDVVQIEEEPSSRLAASTAKLCQRAKIPAVLFSWQSVAAPAGFFARRRASRALAAASGLIGGNERAMKLLEDQAPGTPAIAIPQTGVVMPEAISPDEDDRELGIGFIGRLAPERRPGMLIQALGQTFGHWHLTIAGTGPLQEEVEEAIERLGLASRVHWLGGIRRDVLDEAWGEFDCLVMPWLDNETWVESHSPVLLEAMARGVTPVVTRAGALPELVGNAGVIVEDVESLTEVLQRWVAEPAKCRALGQRARQRVLERYVDSAIAARTLEFWRAVIARQPASAAG